MFFISVSLVSASHHCCQHVFTTSNSHNWDIVNNWSNCQNLQWDPAFLHIPLTTSQCSRSDPCDVCWWTHIHLTNMRPVALLDWTACQISFEHCFPHSISAVMQQKLTCDPLAGLAVHLTNIQHTRLAQWIAKHHDKISLNIKVEIYRLIQPEWTAMPC